MTSRTAATQPVTTLRVQPTPKKGFFLTITDALAEATMGTIISVAAGTYVEADLMFTKPNITLQAEGDGVPLITSHGTTLQITATVAFVGVAIATDDPTSAAVLVAAGQPRFTRCQIQSMHVDMDSEPVVENCTISGSPHTGIFISGNAGGTYRDNTVKNHKGYGVYINGSGSPFFTNNHLSQTLLGPVVICGPRGSPVFKINNVQDSTMIPNGVLADDAIDIANQSAPLAERAAFVITGGCAPTLDGNVIFSCLSHAVVIANQWNVRPAIPAAQQMADVLLSRHTVTPQSPSRPNRRGVAMAPVAASPLNSGAASNGQGSTTTPSLIRNMVRDNQGIGILCVGSSVRATCEGNSIDSNEKGGCRMEGGAHIHMKADVIRGHANCPGMYIGGASTVVSLEDVIVSEGAEGIRCENFGFLRCRNVTIDKLGYGLQSLTSATVDLNDCTIADNDTGIVATDFGTIMAVHTEFRSNSVGTLSTTSGKAKLSHCSLRRNKVAIQSSSGGGGLVQSCIFFESITSHIVVSERGDSHFLDNTFRDANCTAVTIRKCGRGYFNGNTFSNHKQHTIKIESGGDPTFDSNTIESSPVELIVIDKHGLGLFTNNTIRACQRCAICVRAGAEPTFRENTITGNSLGAIDLQDGAGGIYEKNLIRENNGTAVSIRGNTTHRAVVAKCIIEMSTIAVEAFEGVRALVGRCVIRNCQTGVRANKGTEVSITRNDITSCATGVVCAGDACRAQLLFNTIHGNELGGIRVEAGAQPMAWGNAVLGHVTVAIDLCEGSGGKFLDNVVSMNEVGFSCTKGANTAQLMGNAITHNRCGVLCSGNAVGGAKAATTASNGGITSGGGATGGRTSSPNGTLTRTGSLLHGSTADASAAVTEAALPEEATFVVPEPRPKVGPRLIRNALIKNGVGVSLDADSYASLNSDAIVSNFKAGLAIATATSGVHCDQAAFIANGRYNALVIGDAGKGRSNTDKSKEQQQASAGLRRAGAKGATVVSRYEHALFNECTMYGTASPFVVKNGREDVDVRRCAFYSSPLMVRSEGAPRVMQCFMTSCPAAPSIGGESSIKSGATSPASSLPGSIQNLHAAAAAQRQQLQSSSGKRLTSLTSPRKGPESWPAAIAPVQEPPIISPVCIGGSVSFAVLLSNRAKGELLGCIIRAGDDVSGSPVASFKGSRSLPPAPTTVPIQEGIELQRSSTNLRRCLVCGTTRSGISLNHGFAGVVEDCVMYGNEGCGLRISGRMQAPCAVIGCRIFGHVLPTPSSAATSITLTVPPTTTLLSNSHVSDHDLPHGSAKHVMELPDVSEDDAYTGAEPDTNSKLETCPVPKYTMPSTDGPGVGVIVEASGQAILQRCEIFASGLCNLLVLSKNVSLVEKCALHSSDGYGVVVRPQTHLTLKSCSVLSNTYAGMLAEAHSAAIVTETKFSENGIGAILVGDDTEFSRCTFSANRLAGMRISDGSHATVCDSALFNNAVGVECRHNTVTAPQLNYCDIFGNVFVGILATAGSRPNFSNCKIFDHPGVAGVICRCAGAPTLRACRVERNTVGVMVRLFAEPTIIDSVIVNNSTGLVAEWQATGTIMRTTFTSNRTESVLVRTSADPVFKSNIFLNDAPVVCSTEGRGQFEANTFRAPKTGCIIVHRGGNPTVTNTLFAATRASPSQVEAVRRELVAAIKPSGVMTPDMLRPGGGFEASISGATEELAAAVTAVFAPLETTPSSPLGRRTLHVRPDAETEAGQEAVDDAYIPVKVEHGGQGMFKDCVFGLNEPCSLLCDGGTTAPLIENCVFVRHRNVALVVCNQAMPSLVNCVFVQNHLGLQLSRTPIILNQCHFMSNTVAVETDASVTGMIMECTFLDDNLSVNVLPHSGVSIKKCTFYRSDTALVMASDASGFVSECRAVNTTHTAFVIESGAKRITKIDKCVFVQGRGGIKVCESGNADITNCEFYEMEKSGVHILDSANSSVTGCKFVGNGCGLTVEGSESIPHIETCHFAFNKVGLEATMRSNPTAQSCTFLQNKLGIYVYNDGLGIFKCMEMVGNSNGVNFKSGVEGFPSLTHSSILDCDDTAVSLSNHAVGEIVDCQLFDNRVGIYATGSASTLIDHTKVSHPDRKEIGEAHTVVRDGTLVKLLLGPNFQQIFEHSPAFANQNSRQRRLEQSKNKTANTQAMDKIDASNLKSERLARVAIQAVITGNGLEPLLGNLVPSVDSNALNLLDYNPATAAPPAKAQTRGNSLTMSTLGRSLEDAAVKDNKYLVVPAPESTGVRPRPPEQPSAEGNTSELSFPPLPETVQSPTTPGSPTQEAGRGATAAVKITKVNKRKNLLKQTAVVAALRKRKSTLMKPTAASLAHDAAGKGSAIKRAMSMIHGVGDVTFIEPDPSDNLIPSTPLTGKSADATPPLVPAPPPLLPPLPPPPSFRAYPRREVLLSAPNVPVLPVLVPTPPSRLALQCFANPQHGKFGYGSDVHRDTVRLSAMYNPILADQFLNEFSNADKRRREALSVLDFAQYLVGLSAKYGFHPGKFAAAAAAAGGARIMSSSSRGLLTPDDGIDESRPRPSGIAFDAVELTIPVVECPIPTAQAAQVQLNTSAVLSASGAFGRSGSVRPGTPLDAAMRDFAESAWLTIACKSSLDEEITLAEFATIIAEPDTPMAPLFALHFTWMRKDLNAIVAVTPTAAGSDAIRRRRRG